MRHIKSTLACPPCTVDRIDGFNPPRALSSARFVEIVIQYLPLRVFFFLVFLPSNAIP